VYFRQLLNDHTACASYLLGCKTSGEFAVVDPHVDLVDDYVALAEAQGAAIVAVFDTHVQADHVSGLPALVAYTAAAAYLPAGAGVEFDHRPLTDGEVVMLGNVDIAAIATPGQALAHHAYVITDRTRGDEPWLVLTGKPYGQRTGVRAIHYATGTEDAKRRRGCRMVRQHAYVKGLDRELHKDFQAAVMAGW